MGTFLFEEISKEKPFKEEIIEEVHQRVIETLLAFGECAVEPVELYGRRICVYDPTHLLKKRDHYVLGYNRFEEDTWEPSFISASVDDFTGIRSWSIGSKIGYKQHYTAMAVARILCECYAEGKYYVYGDISTGMIYLCLAYIGKKYGFELVHQFLHVRTNVELMEKRPDFQKKFLGNRRYDYYSRIYQDMPGFSAWKRFIEEDFSEDLQNVAKGEEVRYCGTDLYLTTLMLKYLCEHDLTSKLDLAKEDLLTELQKFTQKYMIDTVQQGGKNSAIWEIDFSSCDEMMLYGHHYENCNNAMALVRLCNKRVFIGSVKHFLDGSKRDDAEDVLAAYQKMLDTMVPNKEKVENLQQYQKAWELYYILHDVEQSQEERVQELMERIKEIADMEEEDIRRSLISDRYLRELMLGDDQHASMSDELRDYLADIFSAEREVRYLKATNEVKGQMDGSEDGVRKLVTMAEELSKESIFFSSQLFYRLLEASHTEEGKKKLGKIDFYLKDLSDANKKKAFLWCLQEDLPCTENF